MPRQEFLARLDSDAEWARSNPLYRAAVGKRIYSIAGRGLAPIGAEAAQSSEQAEPFDAVIELWVTDVGSFNALADEQRESCAIFSDKARSSSAVTKEHRIRG